MVIHPARRRLQRRLEDLIEGRITTCQFTRVYSDLERSPDRAVREIARFGWGLYHDDVGPYRVTKHYRIKPETLAMAKRCIQFLQTDLEYQWPEFPFLTWKEIAVTLGVGMPLLGIGLLALAVGRAGEEGLNYLWMWGFFGLIAIPCGFWLLICTGKRERALQDEFWASGDRYAWPFLTDAEYSDHRSLHLSQ